MRRVYAIYLLRRLSTPLSLKVFAAATLAYSLVELVSVSSVWENTAAFAGLTPKLVYSFNAFSNTSFVVQVVLVSLGVCVILAAFDIMRAFRVRETAMSLLRS